MADPRHPEAEAVARAADAVRRAAAATASRAPGRAPSERVAPAAEGARPDVEVAALAARALEQLDALEAALGLAARAGDGDGA